MSKREYEATIGIECHVQLKTKTKLFAAVSNDARDADPNTAISPICLGLPGVLPVLNEKAVELGMRAGIALNGKIAQRMKFDRKHYFYPDLPKGYQITQYDEPIIRDGLVEAPLNGTTLKVRVERAHLEEDAGKTIHPPGADYSLVDLNRAGTPLLEIVSAPDMHTPEEARAYAHELYLLMKYADVSDVDLYQGNMRFDVNVSVAPEGSKALGVRTETKNLNSFRAVERAVAYEIKRQTELLEKGKTIVQETRGWDESKQKTFSQRTKEEAHDYRYFPEPDLPPISITAAQLSETKKEMPKLPGFFRESLTTVGIEQKQVESLLDYPEYVECINDVLQASGKKAARFAANMLANVWLAQDGPRRKNFTISTEQLVELFTMVQEGLLSSTNAKTLFLAVQGSDAGLEQLAEKKGLLQVSDMQTLEQHVDRAIEENALAADDVRNGEMKAIGFLVGQVMKLSKGQANPQKVQELIKKRLAQ